MQQNQKLEKTLIIIKPDGMKKHLAGEIISRFEKKGLTISGAMIRTLTPELAKRHYSRHEKKVFFEELVTFITSGPVFLLILEGENATAVGRQLAGDTDPLKATLGTIRGDYAIDIIENVIHSSDDSESAAREIGIFFGSAPVESTVKSTLSTPSASIPSQVRVPV